jgi:hypothetical protein
VEEELRVATINRFGASQWPAMRAIAVKESGLNPYAINRSSGACGIAQSLPCSKMLSQIGSLDNVQGQINWMVQYVAQRYGSPANAWNWHLEHNWY